MPLKLREKILIPVILTIALGMIAGFVYSYLASTRAVEQSVRNALTREARTTAGLMDKWLKDRHTDLMTWRRAPVLTEALTEPGYYGRSARRAANDLLATLEQGYPYYDFLFVADTSGYLISSSHNYSPKSYIVRDRAYFKASINGRPWISDIITSRESGKKVFVVSVPVRQGTTIVGILAGAVNVGDFSQFYIHDFTLGQKGFAFLAQKSGQVIAVSGTGHRFLDRLDASAHGRMILDTRQGSLVYSHQGEHLLSAFHSLAAKDWIFGVTLSLDEAFASARKTGWYTLAAGLVLMSIVALVVAAIFRHMVYRRFDRMLAAISRVEQGDLSVRIRGGSETDEIGDLTKAFNTMTARLQTTLEDLQKEIQIRKETETALEHHRRTLEVRVAERTAELSLLQDYLSDMINSMPSVIVGVTPDLIVSQWNLRAEQMTGIPKTRALGSPFGSQFPHLQDLAGQMARAIREKEILRAPKVVRMDNEGKGYDDITVYPLRAGGREGAVIRIDDVTERVSLETMMIQSEKMMSVGGLAAGMAHEINNPLAGMIQSIQVLRNRLSREQPANVEAARELGIEMETLRSYLSRRGLFRLMDNAVDAGARAAAIVENMLSFSRKETRARAPVALADLMDRTIDLARNDYDLKKRFDFRDIRIIRHYPDRELTVMAHASMLQQVFFNILKNGAQAMANAPEGQTEPMFTITMTRAETAAQVMIQDNGPGMDPGTCRRIFEPFYTTKGAGSGTGLGLSVSYFIISEHHGGTMEVVSEPGHGACFTIQLPYDGKAAKDREGTAPENQKVITS